MLERIVSISLFCFFSAGSVPAQNYNSPSSPGPYVNEMEMTFRKTVQEVHLDFALSSQNGQPFPGLKTDDFTLYEDNLPVTPTAFHADQNLPLRLLLMIDTSDSMTPGFAAERNAAASFLRNVVRPGIDHSALASFSTHLTFDPAQDASSPQTMLNIGLLRSQGLTALYDSLYESAAAFRAYNGERSATRRVLVLLSDGDDNYSLHSLDATIASVQKSNVIIYAIAAHHPRLFYRGDAILERICADTGGRFFVVKKFEDSEKVFAQIEQEIRSQYSVMFRTGGNGCGYHTLRIEPKDRSLRARSRAGFYVDCQ